MDPSFVLTGNFFGAGLQTSLVNVNLNFGNFTTENVGVLCEAGGSDCVIPATIGGTLNGIEDPYLTDGPFVVPGTNDFGLSIIAVVLGSSPPRAAHFEYSLEGGADRNWASGGYALRWCAAGSCEEVDEGGSSLRLEIEQFTIEISPD